MAKNDDGAGLVIMAFVLGALAGAAVALLMAPTTGEEARRDPRPSRAREGKSTLNSAVERGRQAYQQARGTAAPAEGESAVNDWSVVFLGVIAVSTLVMALIQIGAIIATLSSPARRRR